MPALSFGFGAGEVRLDPAVERVRHRDRPGVDYLGADLAPAAVIVGGLRHGWQLTGSEADVDEVESRYRPVGRDDLELVVRHAFQAVWVQRYTLINTRTGSSAETVRLDDLEIALRAGSTMTGWTMTAGAEAFWLTQPSDGRGPVLAATLQLGDVAGTPEGGWRTGPIELAGGARYVVQWQVDWHPSVADFHRRRPTALPERTELAWPEPFEFTGSDTAVIADPEVAVRPQGVDTLIEAPRPGRFAVELRSSRGTVRLGLTWSEPAGRWVARSAQHWVEGRRTPAGIPRLPDSAAGIVVQQALSDRWPGDTDAAVEALERMAARLLDASELSVFDIALLAGESLRSGDRDCAAAARSAVLARTTAEPGLGLAATRVSLAELAAGVSISPIVARLGELTRAGLEPAERDLTSLGPETGLATLELALITRSQATALSGDVLDRALTLGAEVGAGLPGGPMLELSAAELAYRSALLGLLPEDRAADTTADWAARWSLGPQALADLLRRRSLAALTPAAGDSAGDFAGEGPGVSRATAETLAWLVLSQPTA